MVDPVEQPTQSVREGRTILVVHGNSPWQQNGGGVFLDEFAATLEAELSHLVLALEGRPYDVPAGYPRSVLQIPTRGGLRGMGLLKRLSARWHSIVDMAVVRRFEVRRGWRAVKGELCRRPPQHVVFFLNSVEVLIIAPELRRAIAAPFSTMEWDLLESGIDASGCGRRTRRMLQKRLSELRSGAFGRGVASEGMARFYEEQGLNSLVLRQPVCRPPSTRRRERGATFRIALCGNLYAEEEFKALLTALEAMQWRHGDRSIELHVLGLVSPNLGALPRQVRVTGWMSQAEALSQLVDADLGYCPLWFDPRLRRLTQTSFPSKIVSYMSCGVPLLYHGPSDGTPALFLQHSAVGYACASLDPIVIAARLREIMSDPVSLEARRRAIDHAIVHEFSRAVLHQRLQCLMGT